MQKQINQHIDDVSLTNKQTNKKRNENEMKNLNAN